MFVIVNGRRSLFQNLSRSPRCCCHFRRELRSPSLGTKSLFRAQSMRSAASIRVTG